jgi:cell shape-determining protein MreC
MNYLLDRKLKRNKLSKIVFGTIILIVLIYFRSVVFRGLSAVSHTVFQPVIVLGNNIGDKFSSTGAYFKNKKLIVLKNEELQAQLNEMSAKLLNYNSVLDENTKLKEILGRKGEKSAMTLASILSKPNQSIYDTLIIDAGTNQGVKVGDVVFALGNAPIGRIAEVFSDSSNVILFSNPGEKTDVVISGKDIFMQAIGRGGGNFEIILPRDFVIEKDIEVDLPGTNHYALGIVRAITSDPRDSFQKALLVSPINIQELKFVEVGK